MNKIIQAIRRWWIESTIRFQPKNLSKEDWQKIHSRYKSVGGSSENVLNHIIERDT